MSLIADPTLRVLSSALVGLSRRESATATNVANIDTPGYTPVSVDFESTLQQELGGASAAVVMKTSDPRHTRIPPSGGKDGSSISGASETLRNDGNAVDVDAEMTSLAETQLRYSAVSRLLTGKLGMLRDVITPGGR